jgi:hypothetical protein
MTSYSLPARLLTLVIASFGLCLSGAPAGPEVEVGSVRFAGVRPPQGGGAMWQEIDVNLVVKPAPVSAGGMASRVKVAVLVSYELPAAVGGSRQLQHYRSEAECIALEPGHAHVRFYLPPESVKRDQIRGEPKLWAVDLAVGGRAILPGRLAAATSLTTPEQRRRYQAEAAAGAVANDGILQAQYLTPFHLEYPRSTPSFVRR